MILIECDLLQKLTNSSHIVQELPRSRIGKKAEQNIKLDWKSDDSSEEYDTSGDEDLEVSCISNTLPTVVLICVLKPYSS